MRSDCRDAVCCKFYRATRMTIVGCQRTSLAFLSRWLSPENIRKVGTKAAWTVSPNGLNASISPLGMKKKNALGWWSLRKGGKYLTILAGPVLVLRIFSSALQKTVAFPRSGMENDELDIPNLRLFKLPNRVGLGWQDWTNIWRKGKWIGCRQNWSISLPQLRNAHHPKQE